MRMERAAYNAMQQQKQQPTSRASTGNAAYFPGTCCNPNPRLCPRHSQATFAPAASSSVGTPPASHALPIGHPTQRAGPSRPESSELPRRNPHLRPPLSFISMITKAIVESPEEKLPLNKIYEYIMTKYPYFQYNQKRWQNSVRHSLSFNDCFVKLPRPPGTPGKGSFWTMHPRSKNMFVNGCYLRRYHRFRDEERRRPRPQHVPEFRHPAPTSQSQPQANNMQLVPQNNFMYRRETFYVQSGSNAIPAASPMPAHNQALYSGEMVTQAGFPEYPQARNFNLFPEDPLMLPGPSGVAAVRVENVQVLPSQGPSTIAQLRPSIQMPGPSVVELVGEEALPNQGPSAEMRPTTPM